MDVVTRIAGWRRSPCAGGVVLVAPDGEGRLRIRPREHQPRRLREIVAEVASEVPHARLELARLERFATSEAELAALAIAKLHGADRPVHAAVAIVGDRPFACFDALGDENLCEMVRALADELGAGLGARRRRWFLYDPPTGWFGVRRGERTMWLHPAYPRVAAVATVFDARVFRNDRLEQLDRELFLRIGGTFTPIADEDRLVENHHQLTGRLRIVHGATSTRAVAALADDRFAYFAHLQAPDAADLDVFHELIASFQPLPQVTPFGAMMGLWAD